MEKSLSVITVVRNGQSSIEKTLESIRAQKMIFDYVVIDGESTDGTLSQLSRSGVFIDKLISEKDEGIYDAMNKGATLSKGEWLFFLNSGDILYSNQALKELLDNLPLDVGIVYGDVYLLQSKALKKQNIEPKNYLFLNMICHQSFAVRRDILLKLGGFNIRYRIFADKDFLLRALQSDIKFLYKPVCVAFYDETGVSSYMRWPDLLEHIKVLSQYYSRIRIYTVLPLLWVLSQTKRFLIRVFYL